MKNIILNRGVDEIIIKKSLEKNLNSGKKLRVKFGIDPTSPDIHLGHTVALRKLKQFQDAGHKIVLIIGDFTAQIGDPSGKNKTRPTLTEKEVRKNMKNYLKQAGKVINIKKTEVRHNSEWLAKGTKDLLEIAKSATVNQALRRADFQKRLKKEENISLLETLYPVFQGYDSVAIKADVEIGGTDQKFNLLMGRTVQKHFGIKEQDIITVPLIEGIDGAKKMSKSYGNYIGLDDEPNDMFGKIMSIPDKLIDKYFENLTEKNRKEKDPYKAKINLAENIVSIYNSPKKAEKAKENWKKVFSKGENPEEMETIKLRDKEINIIDLLIKTGIKSKSEAKRLVDQGGISIEDKKIKNSQKNLTIKKESVLKVGKKRFYKIIPQ
ncbi:MAG: tyrosine--tRNA ligase [Candidatus Paceibacterota bacterium]